MTTNIQENFPFFTDEAYAHFCIAANKGDLEKIKELLKTGQPDPTKDRSQALRWAARAGHLEVAKALMPFSDPLLEESYCLRTSVKQNHVGLVNLFLPFSDISALDYQALRFSVHAGNPVILGMFLDTLSEVPEKTVHGLLCEVIVTQKDQLFEMLFLKSNPKTLLEDALTWSINSFWSEKFKGSEWKKH